MKRGLLSLHFEVLLVQLTAENLPRIMGLVKTLPDDQQKEFFKLFEEYERAKTRELAQEQFIPFVHRMWPGFISGRHHKIMGQKFEEIASGKLKRLIICMPPRHTKSEFGSFLFPAWFLGKFPQKKVIQSSHTAELAVGFGRKVRNLVDSDDYRSVFPDAALRADSKAAGRWSTSKGGEYFAIGIGGAVTGKGADILIIDDPHDEQEGQSADPAVFDHAYEWYTSGPRQKPLWPEFWPLEELEAIREEIPTHKWQAQYQQNPTSEEGALIKREWWKVWEQDKPPQCQFLIQSWDTAFLKKERSDYSACTTWGVFYHPDGSGAMQPNIILMDAHKEKMEFPTLKKRAYELYNYWKPDSLIVEAKAAGTPLIFELRAMGIPVAEYTPSRGNDKVARVNAIADLFSSGKIWRPNTRFAEEVVEEFASFPAGEHDDYVDSGTQALLRYRRGGFVSLQSDYKDQPVYKRKISYY